MPNLDPRVHDLQIEYARILAEYRELAAEPFSFTGFGKMQKLVTRLEEIARALDKARDKSTTDA